MDRLESMATLLAAVEAGSLSAASRQLGMPLATVSRKVSELEAHLKTRLLNRTSRRLDPDRCRPVLRRSVPAHPRGHRRSRARRDRRIQCAASGDLVITAPHRVRPPARPARRDGFPHGVSGDRHPARVGGPGGQSCWRIRSISRSASATCPTAASSLSASARSAASCAASPAYFAQRGTPRRPHDLCRA